MGASDALNLLKPLRESLETLRRLSLPVETRLAMQDALQSLSQLQTLLEQNAEQAQLATLYQVSRTLGSTLDLNEALAQVMDAVIQLTHAERGFLMLRDADTGQLSVQAARNYEQENLGTRELDISRTVVHRVLQSGQGVVTTNAQTDPRFAAQESVMMFALRSILCTPLRVAGRVIGVIYADNRGQTGLFSQKDLDLLEALASQAAIAIENARLYTQTDQKLAQRLAELETLAEFDQLLNSNLALERVLEVIYQQALQHTHAYEGWIALFDEERKMLKVVHGKDNGKMLDPQDVCVTAALKERVTQQFIAGENSPAQLVAPILHGGKPIGVVAVEHPLHFSQADAEFLGRLTARAALAIENSRLIDAVQRANQEKSKFVSVVVHELRIPMTSIKGYTDLMRQGAVGPVNEMQLNFLNVIRTNVERMATLVSDLSDISRIETGRLKLENSMFALRPLVDEVQNSLRQKMEEKQQTFAVEISADFPKLYADSRRVVQILTNLVSNAWKYTPNGGSIWLRAEVAGNFGRVTVQDSGIGIHEADQRKLFSQFFRSEDPAVREQQGWGLGLSVTRSLVEMMSGQMGFESVYGKGSTFWFTLPLASV
ncbi:MAG: hypothetical protein OHK0052_01390 [Anaerolineales bacterium]